MFKIYYGTCRVVIKIHRVVFKFPRFSHVISSKHSWKQFIRGCIANLSEFYSYLATQRAPFLVPVFSLGLVNIQIFEEGEIPSEEEMNEHVWSKAGKDMNGLRMFMNPHDLYRNNWRKNARGGTD